jgi:hypothetical protein
MRSDDPVKLVSVSSVPILIENTIEGNMRDIVIGIVDDLSGISRKYLTKSLILTPIPPWISRREIDNPRSLPLTKKSHPSYREWTNRDTREKILYQ